MPESTSTLMRVTPDMARQWLLLTPENYPDVSPVDVARLAGQMVSGRWRVLGATAVSFVGSLANDTARLIDGRRTLNAIAESGVAIDIFVAQNCSEDADLIANTGTTIGLGAYLKLHRKATDIYRLSSLVHLAYAAYRGEAATHRLSGRYLATHEELMEFYDQHPNMPDVLRDATNVCNQLPDHANRSSVGTAMMLFGDLDPEASADFFMRLRNGEIDLLTRFFNQNSKLDPPYRSPQQLAALIKVWNGERTGTRPHRNTARWIPSEEIYPTAV